MTGKAAPLNPQQRQTVEWFVGGGLALAALGLYLLTLAPTVLEADGGEFQFVPWLPGIAHPTGYPLYVLLGWLWTHLLPVGEVAWRMNLLSAVFAALAIGFTYGVARQLVDLTLPGTPYPSRLIAAAIAATTLATSHTFWSQAIIAEVYSFHIVFVAAIIWLALRYRSQAGGEQAGSKAPRVSKNPWGLLKIWDVPTGTAKLLAFTCGLSLTHHRTVILLMPALFLFLSLNPEGLKRSRPAQTAPSFSTTTSGLGGVLLTQQVIDLSFNRVKQLLIYGGLLVAPLLLYLYLPLIAPATPYARLTLSQTQTLTLYDNSLRGFWDHVAGAVFSGALQPTLAGERLVLVWQLLRQQVGWVGVVLALMGLLVLGQRRHFDLLSLTGLGFLAVVSFNLIYTIGDIFVLFIPAWFFVALWLALGSLGLAHWLAGNFVRHKTGSGRHFVFEKMEERLGHLFYRLLVISLMVVFCLLPIVLLVTRKSEVDQQYNVATRARWQEILAEPIPAKAILLSNDRNEIMPLWYYQYVEERRPDLSGLFPLIVPQPAYANVGRVLDQALASGQPVYLIKPMAGLELKANFVPEGTLFRVMAPTTSPTYLRNIVLPEITVQPSPPESRVETIKLSGYDLSPAQASPGAEVRVTLYWQVRQELSVNYTSYVHLLNAEGQGITQNDHQPGGDFYPSSYWQAGEVLRDQHTLTIPANTPPGEYRLRVGMYYQPEAGIIEGMGNGEEIGFLTIGAG